MRSVAGRPETALDLMLEALSRSRRMLDGRAAEKVARRLCEGLEISTDARLATSELLARLIEAYLKLAEQPQAAQISAASFFKALHANGFGKREDRLPVEADRTTVFVRISDIRYVEARGHLVSVVVFDRRFRFRGTLEECEHRLRAHGFLRAHRAYLVNSRHVLAVTPLHSGLYVLNVDDRTRSQIPVSRNYAPEIRSTLSSRA